MDEDADAENVAEIEGGEIFGLDEQYMEELGMREADPSVMEHGLESGSIHDLDPHKPITVPPDTTLADVVARMRSEDVGSVLVVDEAGRLAGGFTERDVLNRVACRVDDLSEAQVSDYMTRNPITLTGGDPIAHALHLMGLYGFRHLPLVDAEKRPVGVISFRDVADFIHQHAG